MARIKGVNIPDNRELKLLLHMFMVLVEVYQINFS